MNFIDELKAFRLEIKDLLRGTDLMYSWNPITGGQEDDIICTDIYYRDGSKNIDSNLQKEIWQKINLIEDKYFKKI
jgi:hypothetical protein